MIGCPIIVLTKGHSVGADLRAWCFSVILKPRHAVRAISPLAARESEIVPGAWPDSTLVQADITHNQSLQLSRFGTRQNTPKSMMAVNSERKLSRDLVVNCLKNQRKCRPAAGRRAARLSHCCVVLGRQFTLIPSISASICLQSYKPLSGMGPDSSRLLPKLPFLYRSFSSTAPSSNMDGSNVTKPSKRLIVACDGKISFLFL